MAGSKTWVSWAAMLGMVVFVTLVAVLLAAFFLPSIPASPLARLGFAALIYPPMALFGVCFYRAVVTQARSPGADYRLPRGLPEKGTGEREAFLASLARERGLVLGERSGSGAFRVCDVCRLLQPDRAHHCAHCARCVLRFDHYCAVIHNCVGYHNWKYDSLMVLYGALTSLAGAPIALYYCVQGLHALNEKERPEYLDLACRVFLAAAFLGGCYCGLPLAIYNFLHMGRNCTTRERQGLSRVWPLRAPTNSYDHGWIFNLRQVLGRNPFLALLPVFTDQTDGHTFRSHY